jgi:hypothetical protein
MASSSNVQLTIALQEPDLDDEERQKETEILLGETAGYSPSPRVSIESFLSSDRAKL